MVGWLGMNFITAESEIAEFTFTYDGSFAGTINKKLIYT